MVQVADGLEYRCIYWFFGQTTKDPRFRVEVKEPPTNGWQHAFVLTTERGLTTLFCPQTLTAFQVSSRSAELGYSIEAKQDYHNDRVVKSMQDKWAQFQSFGWLRDYDVCANILRRLGAEVPEQLMKGGGEDNRVKGGKEVGKALEKPVKRDGKRGKFLKWFLDAGGSASVREAMAVFGMTRSNALSYLYMIQKDHGIGYTLVGDTATVQLPDGCINPFDTPDPDAPEGPVTHTAEGPVIEGFTHGGEQMAKVQEGEDDDSWLD